MDPALPFYDDVLAAQARIADVARKTPVLTSDALNEAAGASVFLKAECLQVTGSFKIRGAYNRLAQLTDAERKTGVVAFSSGNHAQGIARAAKLLGMPALIVMPSDAPEIKVSGVRADGGIVHLYDRASESREDIAAALAHKRRAVLVPSFDDPHIIAGQGTVGLELATQMAERHGGPLDHLICCAGGGGLISGTALAFEKLSPQTKIWTAEPEGHDDWKRSLEAGEIIANAPGTRSICDAILTPQPGKLTWAIGKRLLSGGFAVSDTDVKYAIQGAHQFFGLMTVEPGGAAALAVAARGLPENMRGARVGVIATGRNVDGRKLKEYLEFSG